MPELKELLGDAYKEGMTFDEASAALKDRKIVDLSTGSYVGKGKYDEAIKERDDAIKERDDAKAKVKDYDALVKYRDENEADKSKKALDAKLSEYGVKDDMLEFVRFQIESKKIERGKDDKDLEKGVKEFLKTNPQYAKQAKKENGTPNPKVSTGINGDGNGGNDKGWKPAKVVKAQPWNRHKAI